MTSDAAGRGPEVLALLGGRADHRDAERALRAAGWTACGAGDWAIALRSPDGGAAARISPFDPTGPYSAALYREAAHTRQVPELFAHRRLTGGGDLQVLEWLRPVPEDEAVAFLRAIAARAPEVADLVAVVRRIHDRARRELPWCGPLDKNPANVMRAADGRLLVADLFYADGPNLYATAAADPDLVVARIPEAERRFMTEIPLAASGPWEPGAREAMRAGLAAADARAAEAGQKDKTVSRQVVGLTSADMSGEVIILTGPPAAGKTTVAELLAGDASVPTVHLTTDLFYRAIRTGFVLPFLPEAQRQNEVVIDAIVATVGTFARGGYDVVVDGIVGPWFLPPFLGLAEQDHLAVSYVVLRPDLETTLSRASQRVGRELRDVAAITGLHAAFAQLGDLEEHAIDTGDLEADQTVAEVRRVLASGKHRLT